jgi:hypothetical protein
MTPAQMMAFSHQKYIDAHPQRGMQLFGPKSPGDGQQKTLLSGSHQSIEAIGGNNSSKRKRCKSFMAFIGDNMGLTYAPNSTPIAVKALSEFEDSTALFAFNKLAYTLRNDPRLKKYDIHRQKGQPRSFEEGKDYITCTHISNPLDEQTLQDLVRLAHEDPAATALPPIPVIELDWDNLDSSVLSESVVFRLGIEGNAARTTANSNALALHAYAHSLCMHKTEDGVVTIELPRWVHRLDELPGYTDLIRSATVEDSDTIRLKVNAMLPFRRPEQLDVEDLIDYADKTIELMNNSHLRYSTRRGNYGNRGDCIRAVGKNPQREHVRLFSSSDVEQTLWQDVKFLTMSSFANVLSDFLGNIKKTQMESFVPMVTYLIAKNWVWFPTGLCYFNRTVELWYFSTRAFKTIARVFALASTFHNMSARRIKLIGSYTGCHTCQVTHR